MQTLGVLQGSVWCRWLDQGFGKTPLILSGQAEDGMLLNGSLGGIWAVLAARQPHALPRAGCLQHGVFYCGHRFKENRTESPRYPVHPAGRG
jgi:hypothetical protein